MDEDMTGPMALASFKLWTRFLIVIANHWSVSKYLTFSCHKKYSLRTEDEYYSTHHLSDKEAIMVFLLLSIHFAIEKSFGSTQIYP